MHCIPHYPAYRMDNLCQQNLPFQNPEKSYATIYVRGALCVFGKFFDERYHLKHETFPSNLLSYLSMG